MIRRHLAVALLVPLFTLGTACGGSSGGAPGGDTPGGGTGGTTPPPGTVASNLSTGSGKLQAALSSNSTDDFLASANAYGAAATLIATDTSASQASKDQANFFGAAARLALLANPYSSTASAGALNSFGDMLDAFGLGGTQAQRGRIDKLQVLDCNVQGCVLKTFPPGCPRSRDVQAFLLNKLGQALEGAAAMLGKVSSGFQLQQSFRGMVVKFDQTDALFLKGVAEAMLAQVRFQKAYDLDFDMAALQATITAQRRSGTVTYRVPDFLNANPNFLKLADAASLASGKAALLEAIHSLQAAVTSLRAETGDQSHDFIKLVDTQCNYYPSQYSCTNVYNAPQQLADVDYWLAQAESVVSASGPMTLTMRTPDTADDVTINPSKFFAGIDMRSKLPNTWSAGGLGNSPGFFPDPSFGGVLVTPLPVNRDLDGDGSPDWLMGVLHGFRYRF